MTEKEFKEAEKINNSIRYARAIKGHIKSVHKKHHELKIKYLCDLFSKGKDEIPCIKTHEELIDFVFKQILTFAHEKERYFEDKLHKL